MILDKNLEFDPGNTPVTVTAASTNVLDMAQQRDMGSSPEGMGTLEVSVTVQAAFTAAGAATLNIQVQGSVDNLAWTTLGESGAIPKANLGLGQHFDIVVPSQLPGAGIPRYYRLNYVVAVGPFLTGQVQSEMTAGLEHQPMSTGGVLSGYGSGFTVGN